MATHRFFWLPWPSDNAVGTQTRLAQAPTGYPGETDIPQGLYTIIDFNKQMASYAVTRDPDRVPLVETGLTFTQVQPAGIDYPHNAPYAYSSTNCAYRLVDAGIPANRYFWYQHLQPWAFFSYRLRNTTQINMVDFLRLTGQIPQPFWIRGRRIGGTTYGNGYTAEVAGDNQAGVRPMLAYVLRPSTGNIVGWLMTGYITGGYGPCNAGACNLDATSGSPQSTVFPGPTNNYYRQGIYPNNYHWGNAQANITGIQDDDLLVWEWWAQAFYGCGSWMAPTNNWPSGQIQHTYEVFVGGGQAGQPLTLNTGVPNWAPSWGVYQAATTIDGIEPSPPRNTQISVGF